MLATRPLVHVCATDRRTLCVRSFHDDRVPSSSLKKVPAKKALKEEKPKALRAPSAFNLFVKATFPQVKKDHPEMKFADAGAVVRERWLNATPDARAPYEREAAEKKAVVNAKRAEALAEKKAKARPPTAFMLFASRNRSAVAAENPGKPVTVIATLLGKAWRQLSAEEQQKLKDESKGLREAWKAKQEAPV